MPRSSASLHFVALQAKRAAEMGVCIDLSVVTNAFVGLSSIKFLSILTGGNLQVYEDPEGATLPQNLYGHLALS